MPIFSIKKRKNGLPLKRNDHGALELTVKELNDLIALIRKYPEIAYYPSKKLKRANRPLFDKINNAYLRYAMEEEILDLVKDSIRQRQYDFDGVKAMIYCEKHCGFNADKYEYVTDDSIRCSFYKLKAFSLWLDDNVDVFDYKTCAYFYFNLMNDYLCIRLGDYVIPNVSLPNEIINLAKQE